MHFRISLFILSKLDFLCKCYTVKVFLSHQKHLSETFILLMSRKYSTISLPIEDNEYQFLDFVILFCFIYLVINCTLGKS